MTGQRPAVPDPDSAAVSPTPPVALTIAGSDSGGGAGIQADLATFGALGVHGTSVITAITAQNTHAVTRVHVPPVEVLDAQLDAVLSDLPVAAVKTGMLASVEVMDAVARRASSGGLPNLVVDPVLVSSAGDRLFAEDAATAYIDGLFRHALIVTPNAREAAVLLGWPVDSVQTMSDQREAARALASRGRLARTWIVIKGGHLPPENAAAGGVAKASATSRHEVGEAVDVVLEPVTGDFLELRAPWIETANDHGTGCTFAAATAAHLALGRPPQDALRAAKAFVHRALARSQHWNLGAGHGPVAHVQDHANGQMDTAK